MAPSIALDALPEATGTSLRVLDPMIGSGTTGVVARSRGHISFGFDTDPLAVVLSKTWTLTIDEAKALSVAGDVLNNAKLIYKKLKQSDAYPMEADEETKKFIRYWFDATNRRQLRALSEVIFNIRCEDMKNIMWSAFSRLIIAKKNGASLAMDLSHSRPHKVKDKPVIKPLLNFIKEVKKVVNNIPFKVDDKEYPRANITLGDAREIPLPESSIDIVITSPPYLNAIDYIRCSKFTLVWMGYRISSLSALRSRIIGTENSKGIDENDPYLSQLMQLMGNIEKLPVKQKRILARYIRDLDYIIREVARVLTHKGRAIFVIGNSSMKGVFLKNSEVIKRIGREYGLQNSFERKRMLPDNRRYLPPPLSNKSGKSLQRRMNEEVVLNLSFEHIS